MNAASGFRCGTVAIAGRPNVGKSTLLNALLGQKLSIVTPKAQTTRHRILGVLSRPEFQLLLLDTPGLHAGRGRRLNQAMNREAMAAITGADAALLVADATRWTDDDETVLARLVAAGLPVVLVLNKVDRVRPRARLLPLLQELGARHGFAAIVPISALHGDNLERLLTAVAALLPESQPLFPPDQVTDRSERFLAGEILREQLTLQLHEELPYGIAVEIERFEDLPDGRLAIDAVIWVERESQRSIVIGAGGQRLKSVGRAARLELNRVLERRVHLSTWVRVREGWTDDDRLLGQLGYESR